VHSPLSLFFFFELTSFFPFLSAPATAAPVAAAAATSRRCRSPPSPSPFSLFHFLPISFDYQSSGPISRRCSSVLDLCCKTGDYWRGMLM
ncbi:hypothetical protein LINGRAHAP2_LOCUS4341, partial [Linum grandiflorum]